jgi:hypothetical protein
VADTPKNPGERRASNSALATNDSCDGDNMIGVGGVPHSEKEAE